MVHALKQTQRILRPNGLLINVHDLPTPQVVEVHAKNVFHKVGWIVDREDMDNTRSALKALAQVVNEGDLFLEDERDFAFNIYADNLPEMQAYLAEWWSSAVIAENIIARIKVLLKYESQPAKIVLALRARMTKLRTDHLIALNTNG